MKLNRYRVRSSHGKAASILADEVVLDRMGRPGLKAPLAQENYSGAGDVMLAIVEEEMDFLKNGNDDLM